MVHDVSAVLGLQDPEVPVHIGYDVRAVDACINHFWDNRDPMRMEGRSLNRLAFLTLYGSDVSYSLPQWLLKE